MEALQLKVDKELSANDLNGLAETTGKITDAKIEKSLNYEELSEEEKKAIEEFNNKIDVTDAAQVLQFGSAAQNKISEFSDSILENVKTKNTGEVGDLLADLVSQIKSFDNDISGSDKGLAKIFSNAKRQLDKIIA